MPTVDLTNDIAPTHPRRPVRLSLSELRRAIKKADTGGVYAQSYLDKLNRNDLTYIARRVGATIPFSPDILPTAWAAATVYAVKDRVLTNNGLLEATVAGTSAGVAPTLPAVGSTVVDNGVTWKRLV